MTLEQAKEIFNELACRCYDLKSSLLDEAVLSLSVNVDSAASVEAMLTDVEELMIVIEDFSPEEEILGDVKEFYDELFD